MLALPLPLPSPKSYPMSLLPTEAVATKALSRSRMTAPPGSTPLTHIRLDYPHLCLISMNPLDFYFYFFHVNWAVSSTTEYITVLHYNTGKYDTWAQTNHILPQPLWITPTCFLIGPLIISYPNPGAPIIHWVYFSFGLGLNLI